ncbi:MAG: hypothetical protein J5I91_03935 [Bacteroidetes bacterium]|nr:hypothetical protein [Bacteroidota bacterium]
MRYYIFGILLLFIFFGCTRKKHSENKELSSVIESYQQFLIQFEKELNKSKSNNANTDEWESASQSLLINSQRFNDEIRRFWKKGNTNSNSDYLEKWAQIELHSYRLEIFILNHWQRADLIELQEAHYELVEASKIGNKTDSEISILKEKILIQIKESKENFERAIEDVKIRERELSRDNSLLVKP